MRLATIGSIALLTVSSAALAQMTTKPTPMPGNTTTMPQNGTMPNSSMPMNSADGMPMNDMSAPNSTAN